MPSAAVTQIEEAIALNTVVVVSKTTCGFCADAKKALKQAGAGDVLVIELDKLGPKPAQEIQEHMGVLTGATTVPRVFIGRRFVGGGSETVKMHETGELADKIKDALARQKAEIRGDLSSATVVKGEHEWASLLSPEVMRIARGRSTERPHSHDLNKFLPEKGHFACVCCGLPMYSAKSKYASNCGWPVFDSCYHSDAVGCHVGTRSDGSGSLEIFCPQCNSHLGHVFFDSFSGKNLNGERH